MYIDIVPNRNSPPAVLLRESYHGTLTNRGTEWDWLRFWWDLTTDQDVYCTDCMDIWNTANPDTWNASGDGSGSNYPATRLRNAANTEGFLTEWDNEDYLNGVYR